MSRDWSFRLYHQDVKNQSNAAITELKADIEHLQRVRQRLREYIHDRELISRGFTAIRLKSSDTVKAIEGLILAAELDIRDHRILIEAVGNEDLLGFDIQGEYEAAKAQAEYYARQAEYFQGDRFIVEYINIYSRTPGGLLLPNQHRQARLDMVRRNAYTNAAGLRDAYTRLADEWLEKAATYDRIEEATKNLFQSGRELRDKANKGLRFIAEASRGLPNRFTHPELARWRSAVLVQKFQAESRLMDTSVLVDIDSLDEEVKELWKLLRSFRDHPDLADLSDEEFRKHLAWELELFILAREFEPIMIDYVMAADEVREGTVTLGGRTPWADLRFLTNYELFSGVDIAKRKEILSFLRGEHEKAEGIEGLGDMERKGRVDDFLNTLFDGSPPDRVTGVSVDIAYGASYGHMTLGDVLHEDMRRNVMQMTAAFAALGMIYAMGINTPFKKPVLSRPKPRGTGGYKPPPPKTLDRMTPREIANLSEAQLRQSLPNGWSFHKHNGRIHIKDTSGNVRVRVDPANAREPQHMHIYDRNQNLLDINGNVVGRKDPAGHIPWN